MAVGSSQLNPAPPYPPRMPVPAPQSPEGRRPVCIQSLFILCSSLMAVMDTSWFFSPNSSRWAKRGMYRQGSAGDTHLSVALGRRAPLLPSSGVPRPPVCCTSSQGPLFPDGSPPGQAASGAAEDTAARGQDVCALLCEAGQACVCTAQALAEAPTPAGCFVGILRITSEAEQIFTHSFSAFTFVEQQLRPPASLSGSVCAPLK